MKTIVNAIIVELVTAKGLKGEEWLWSPESLAWAAYTKMWYESRRFSIEVHDGTKRGDRGRSVCLGQIMYGGTRLVGTGLTSTKRCVARVMQILITHQHGCLRETAKPTAYAMSMIYAAYGTGRTCNPNHFVIVKDKRGIILKDKDGKPKRRYWARNRGWKWYQLMNGNNPAQKKMLKQ